MSPAVQDYRVGDWKPKQAEGDSFLSQYQSQKYVYGISLPSPLEKMCFYAPEWADIVN